MFKNRRARLSIFLLCVFLISFAGFPRLCRAQAQSPFLGSVPTGKATEATLELSLQEAFERALKYNLGVIESGENTACGTRRASSQSERAAAEPFGAR